MKEKYKLQSPVDGVVLSGIVLPSNYVDSKEYRAQGMGFTSWAGRPYRLDQHGNPYYKCKTCSTWKPASSRYYYKVGNHCITRFSLRQKCKQCFREESATKALQFSQAMGLAIHILIKYKQSSASWEYRGAFATKVMAIAKANELAMKEDAVYRISKKHTLFKVIPDQLQAKPRAS